MAHDLYKQIGDRIRRGRERLKLSQEDLARSLGYSSPTTISYYEAGDRKVSIADLTRIAEILSLPVDYFLGTVIAGSVNPTFQLRAREVRPFARKALDSFLVFAQKNGGPVPKWSEGLKELAPDKAATTVLKEAKAIEPPFRIRSIISELGVRLFEWEFPDEISGVFVSDGKTVSIGINDKHAYTRQRFTIAHELGHLVYSDEEDLFVDYSDAELAVQGADEKQRQIEIKANKFAAHILMPKACVHEDVERYGIDVTMLAKRYEVSEQSMWFRLINLGLVDKSEEA